jgi:hypothetical protein
MLLNSLTPICVRAGIENYRSIELTRRNSTFFLELYTGSVFWYEPFCIFLVFTNQISKGNSVGKFSIIKLAGAIYTHMV